MKYIFVVAIVVLFFSCKSKSEEKKNNESVESSVVTLTTDSIPSQLKITGTPRYAWHWHDQESENYLVLSYQQDTTDEGYTNILHASHYALKGSDYSLIWKKDDTVLNCEFDITSDFIQEATSITDLDDDGLAEVTVQYKQACRSDVSPAVMKLSMHEGKAEYTLQGLTFVKASDTDSFTVTEQNANLEKLEGYTGKEEEYLQTFGRYESEKSFASAPESFLAHARKQWMRYIKEFTE